MFKEYKYFWQHTFIVSTVGVLSYLGITLIHTLENIKCVPAKHSLTLEQFSSALTYRLHLYFNTFYNKQQLTFHLSHILVFHILQEEGTCMETHTQWVFGHLFPTIQLLESQPRSNTDVMFSFLTGGRIITWRRI